jgi:hypothetical protein
LFNVQDLAIGLGGIFALCVTIITLAKQWSGRGKIKNITNSDWNFVTEELKELRKDSDRHKVIIAKMETTDEFIKAELQKISDFVDELRQKASFPCPHHPLKKEKSENQKC